MKKLNLGCGEDYKEDFINLDINKKIKADVYADINKPLPFKDNTFDYVYCKNILEHLESPENVLLELWRICKNGAIIEIIHGYWNNKGMYNHFQIQTPINETAFKYFVKHNFKKFKIKTLKLKPSLAGKFIFWRWLREKLSLFISGLIERIVCELEVLK